MSTHLLEGGLPKEVPRCSHFVGDSEVAGFCKVILCFASKSTCSRRYKLIEPIKRYQMRTIIVSVVFLYKFYRRWTNACLASDVISSAFRQPLEKRGRRNPLLTGTLICMAKRLTRHSIFVQKKLSPFSSVVVRTGWYDFALLTPVVWSRYLVASAASGLTIILREIAHLKSITNGMKTISNYRCAPLMTYDDAWWRNGHLSGTATPTPLVFLIVMWQVRLS